MTVLQRWLAGSVLKLTRLACVFAILGLGLMCYSIVDPRAIPVIVAMSVGHAFGIAAFACYLLAVILDVRRGAQTNSMLPASAPTARHSVANSIADTQNSRTEEGPVS
jgi:hypothetical protein